MPFARDDRFSVDADVRRLDAEVGRYFGFVCDVGCMQHGFCGHAAA